MKIENPLNLSLNEIEGFHPNLSGLGSGTIERCMIARTVKLKDLSVEDIRILLTQKNGINYIVPIALNILEENPLIFSGRYRGDLLCALLNLGRETIDNNSEWNNQLMEIKIEVEEIQKTIVENVFPLLSDFEYV